ncbi:MAG: DUF565 domain-containing protein [Geitlerinemataceae cyanobacterium]
MQNTRLNTLVSSIFDRINQQLRNPWRRLLLLVLGLLFGFFLGTAISTISGQIGELDLWASFILLVATEIVNWLVYSNDRQFSRLPLVQTLNAIKIGLIYSMYLEAFKLGS